MVPGTAVPLDRTDARRVGSRPAVLAIAVAAVVFAVHAACYLYFFVDDEAIPLVYASNLLRGYGLTYNPQEGRVEGYTDFLHVLWNTLVLAFTRAASLPRLTPLDVGKGVSFAFGIGLVLIVGRMLMRLKATLPGLVAGLATIALAGPVAVWSCSSLEAVPFAFGVVLFAALLFAPSDARPRWLPALVGALLLLDRLDGFVYAGVLIATALVAVPPARRRTLLRDTVFPIVLVAIVYHAARFAYFGSLLSAPLDAKVLYKLTSPGRVVTKAPLESYLRSFMDLYSIALLPALAVALVAVRHDRRVLALAAAVALLSIYVGIVGDWMFGWRFLVPIIPLAAVVVGEAVSRARIRLAWGAAVIVVGWAAAGAHAFARDYVTAESKPLWWNAPHRGPEVWLAPYGTLIPAARKLVHFGDTIAYNQAGLLPFVLDVDNVDDLGICSRFEAALPTTDVYFTEVGRYSPLTNAPVIGAEQAYLLYRNVRVLVSRTDLLRNANGGRIPPEVMAGYFRLASTDPSGDNALYVRTLKDASAYQRDPSLFEENLAHTSHVRSLSVDGSRVAVRDIPARLPFLRWLKGDVPVHGATRLDIRFSETDEDVHAIYAGTVAARGAVAVTINLYDARGQLVASEDAQADRTPAPLLVRYDSPVRARTLSIEARAASGDDTLTLGDLRIQGQSSALAAYVRRMLRFPAPPSVAGMRSLTVR